MEIFRSRAEVSRRERAAGLIDRVDGLMPQEDDTSKGSYKSYYFAPRVRLRAYEGYVSAKSLLSSVGWLDSQDNITGVSVGDGHVSISSGKHICFDLEYDDSFNVKKVNSSNFVYSAKDWKSDNEGKDPNTVMEDLLAAIHSDLSDGRSDWSEILAKRREEFCGSQLVLDEVRTLSSRTSGNILVAKETESEATRRIFDMYAPEVFKYDSEVNNLLRNYTEVSCAKVQLHYDDNGNEVLNIDFPLFRFRLREFPKMNNDLASKVAEESFEDFMTGYAGFDINSERLGEVTLLKYNSYLCPNL